MNKHDPGSRKHEQAVWSGGIYEIQMQKRDYYKKE